MTFPHIQVIVLCLPSFFPKALSHSPILHLVLFLPPQSPSCASILVGRLHYPLVSPLLGSPTLHISFLLLSSFVTLYT